MRIAILALVFWNGVAMGTAASLALNVRSRIAGAAREAKVAWDPAKTAVVVCDMWNEHWCKSATRRVAEMAPRMNEFLIAARKQGVLILHAPSSCMAAYANHPARKRAQAAPKAKDLPPKIGNWAKPLPSEAGVKWPVDQADGGCDDQPPCKQGHPWKSQIDTLAIHDEDAITDSGVETWNLFAQRGIENVIVLGVHTNMCVIGRPFGLRNMVAHGKNVLLVRDLTDTMYNPRQWPHVSHFEGTRRVVAHIEQYVCGTIVSTDLTGKPPFVFEGEREN
jgi:nicotinamidase-related amidase